MKLHSLLSRHLTLGRSEVQRLIVTQRAIVDGVETADPALEVDRFMRVEFRGGIIQPGERRLRILLHKPAGWLSATTDPVHPVVTDLVTDPDRHTLHVAGRLDRSSTGLLLLTNDGNWSKQLTGTGGGVPKVYLVETAESIAPEAVAAFARGFYFHTEDITTLPAELEILSARQARVTLREGRYHQIKRMFHRTGNRVIALHRERIGQLSLPPDLAPGEWRALSPAESASALQQ